MVYFISDLHFGHDNVLKFDNRPWHSIDEMNKDLIKKWNNKVKVGDLVYVLGDLIWKNQDYATEILKQLNGNIILIKGNHDRFLHNAKNKALLAAVKDYDDIKVTLQDGTVKRVILSHYFMPMYNGHYHGTIHLHGHSHNSKECEKEWEIAKELNSIGMTNEIYNVWCGFYDYEPVTLDEIIKKWK